MSALNLNANFDYTCNHTLKSNSMDIKKPFRYGRAYNNDRTEPIFLCIDLTTYFSAFIRTELVHSCLV